MSCCKGIVRKIICWTICVLVLVGIVVGYVAWSKLLREVPQELANDTPEEQFKYGSIGVEEENGIPYYVWVVLPRMFPEYLPKDADGKPRGGGYAAVGMVWEQGRETPVGFPKRTIGFPRVGINCAACHTATYRTEASGELMIVPTGPSQRFDTLGYQQFLSACASDPRFTADNILREIEYNFELSLLDKFLYRNFIIPLTRQALLDQKERFAWTRDAHHKDAVWGPGRIDPFNPVKFGMLGLPVDKTIGNSDMQPIWSMQQREGHSLHTDGLNTSLTEVIHSGALGDGATNRTLPVDDLARLESYIKTKQPPPYPFADELDLSLVAEGRANFTKQCASCHEYGGDRTGSVIKLAEIGTDSNRLEMWTKDAVKAYNSYSRGYAWDFEHFEKTDGYVAVPLNGLWLRAPYLHNGSVPTLDDLLEPSDKRPKRFYRGYDVYDRKRVGFIHDERAKREGFLFDTTKPGNSNRGHEGTPYGTKLKAEEKRALIEYLKTL